VEAARVATVADLPDLVALAGACVAELGPTRGGRLWEARDFRARPYESSLRADLHDEQVFVAVGTFDGAVLGYIVVRTEALRGGGVLARTTDLYVEPEARGVGIGEAMMDLVLAWCRDRSCTGIDAGALPGNRATKNFFERFGLVARAIVVHRSLEHEPAGDD